MSTTTPHHPSIESPSGIDTQELLFQLFLDALNDIERVHAGWARDRVRQCGTSGCDATEQLADIITKAERTKKRALCPDHALDFISTEVGEDSLASLPGLAYIDDEVSE